MLPIGVDRLALFAELSALTGEVTVHVRRTGDDGAYATADALLLGPAGDVLAEFRGVRMRRTTTVTRTPAATTLTRTPAAATGAPAAVPVRREPLPVSRIDWRPEEGDAARREAATGTWVVFHHGPADRLGTGAAEALRADGARVVEVAAGPAAPPDDAPGPDRLTLERLDPDAFRALWERVGDPVAGVVHLWNADGPADGGRGEEEELGLGLYACLAALRTLGERQRKSRFLVVTRDGQPVADGDRPVPARAALWGLMRTAAIEYPGLRPRLVDLGGGPGTLLPALAAELSDARGPVETGYRDGVRHVPVRVRDRSAYTPPRPAGQGPVRPGGRYLVLGGHGGLGLEVAERFAREGAGVVALVSRSGGNPGSDERAAALAAHGCLAVSYSADITAPGALTALVERMRREHGEVHGVVHAAGTLKDGLIRSATAEDVAAVMRPKADGVRELAAAVAGADLDFAVLFASVSGTFGNLGQGGYAAANAYLDGYAHAHGAPWLSVDWGLWGEVGMGTAVADQLRARGVRPLTTAEGLDALIAVLGTERPAGSSSSPTRTPAPRSSSRTTRRPAPTPPPPPFPWAPPPSRRETPTAPVSPPGTPRNASPTHWRCSSRNGWGRVTRPRGAPVGIRHELDHERRAVRGAVPPVGRRPPGHALPGVRRLRRTRGGAGRTLRCGGRPAGVVRRREHRDGRRGRRHGSRHGGRPTRRTRRPRGRDRSRDRSRRRDRPRPRDRDRPRRPAALPAPGARRARPGRRRRRRLR